MCGIGGLFDTRGCREPPAERLAAMGRALKRREGEGIGVFSAAWGAIICARPADADDVPESRPFEAGDGIVAAVRGSIYGHVNDMPAEMGGRSASDRGVEIVSRAWSAGGVEGLSDLEGEFALAVWDRAAGRLCLAVDAFRSKTLFWTEREGWIEFASDARALLPQPVGDEDIEWASVCAYLRWGCVPGGAPPLRGIRTLRPGGAAIFERGRTTPAEIRLFRFDEHKASREGRASVLNGCEGGNGAIGPEDILDALRAAVAARLQGDRLPGIWLSGGVDSGLVAVLARRAAGEALDAFTLGVEGPGYDERPLARLSARAAGVRLHESSMKLRSLEDLLPAFSVCDVPLADTSIHTTMALARMTSPLSKSILSGEGGDELFGGYYEYRLERLERLLRRPLFGAVALMAGAAGRILPSGDPRLSAGDIMRRFAAGAFDVGAPHAWRWRRCMGDADISAVFLPGALGNGDGVLPSAGIPEFQRLGDPRDTYLSSILPDMLLPKADRAGFFPGVEARFPYLDPRVVAVARIAPLTAGKRPLREACRGLLPPEVVAGRKRGFSAPVRAWLRAEGAAAEVREYLAGPESRLAPRLRSETLDRWLAEHRSRRADRSREVHALLALENWLRRVGGSA